MTELVQRESARIFQFPTAGVRPSNAQHDDVRITNDVRATRSMKVAMGGAWYHDAAIQDAKRAGER